MLAFFLVTVRLQFYIIISTYGELVLVLLFLYFIIFYLPELVPVLLELSLHKTRSSKCLLPEISMPAESRCRCRSAIATYCSHNIFYGKVSI